MKFPSHMLMGIRFAATALGGGSLAGAAIAQTRLSATRPAADETRCATSVIVVTAEDKTCSCVFISDEETQKLPPGVSLLKPIQTHHAWYSRPPVRGATTNNISVWSCTSSPRSNSAMR